MRVFHDSLTLLLYAASEVAPFSCRVSAYCVPTLLYVWTYYISTRLLLRSNENWKKDLSKR